VPELVLQEVRAGDASLASQRPSLPTSNT